MNDAAAVILKWTGRALVLFAPYVIVCSLFAPGGVQFLNPLVCPDGQELSNRPYRPQLARDDSDLQVSCVDDRSSESAVQGVALVVVGSLATGLALIYLGQRLHNPRYRAPSGPGVH